MDFGLGLPLGLGLGQKLRHGLGPGVHFAWQFESALEFKVARDRLDQLDKLGKDNLDKDQLGKDNLDKDQLGKLQKLTR